MTKSLIVMALGGNALLRKGEKLNIETQIKNSEKAAKYIIPVLKNHSVVITHGNGPQVGNIVIRVEQSLGKAYALPLEVCVAESEGEIGYIMEQSLINAMNNAGIKKPIATMLTQVVVDKNDRAFSNPEKPIGKFYTKSQIRVFKNKKIPFVEDAGRGYRRVVSSPKPIKIVEGDVIKKLLKEKVIVIAAGGGGIPVIEAGGGKKKALKGVEAVIDKDLASACLANSVGADTLMMLTGEDCVYFDYGTKKQRRIPRLFLEDAESLYEENYFPAGSMAPKILAAINFIKNGGKRVIITSPEKLQKALKGKEGTAIIY